MNEQLLVYRRWINSSMPIRLELPSVWYIWSGPIVPPKHVFKCVPQKGRTRNCSIKEACILIQGGSIYDINIWHQHDIDGSGRLLVHLWIYTSVSINPSHNSSFILDLISYPSQQSVLSTIVSFLDRILSECYSVRRKWQWNYAPDRRSCKPRMRANLFEYLLHIWLNMFRTYLVHSLPLHWLWLLRKRQFEYTNLSSVGWRLFLFPRRGLWSSLITLTGLFFGSTNSIYYGSYFCSTWTAFRELRWLSNFYDQSCQYRRAPCFTTLFAVKFSIIFSFTISSNDSAIWKFCIGMWLFVSQLDSFSKACFWDAMTYGSWPLSERCFSSPLLVRQNKSAYFTMAADRFR